MSTAKSGNDHKIRILLSKIGFDAHDRGVRFVANGLLQAGMEVIYLGNFNLPEGIVRAAIDEGVDAIGLSVLSGEYIYYLPHLMQLMREQGVGEVPVVIGGLVPPEEEPFLTQLGIKKIFHPGATLEEIQAGITEVVQR
jgi:methylmalonyl-CoA mutase C-terminal domain/subunit